MSIAVIAHSAAAGNNTTAATPPKDTTGANLIVVGVTDNGSIAIAPLTDSKGNTPWIQVRNDLNGSARSILYYFFDPIVGVNHTFTYTGSGATQVPAIAMIAFSGSLSSPLDQQNGANQVTGSTLATGNVTPGFANEVVVTILNGGITGLGSFSINQGFTISDTVGFGSGNNFGTAMAYIIQTSAVSKDPTWSFTTGFNSATSIATFKGTPPPTSSGNFFIFF